MSYLETCASKLTSRNAIISPSNSRRAAVAPKRSRVVALALAIVPSVPQADCLDRVTAFAQTICGDIEKSDFSQVTEGNGQLKAEVSGIIRRVVAGGEADVNAKMLRDSYENVLRQDLGKQLFNARDCRMKMVNVGKGEACKLSGSFKSEDEAVGTSGAQIAPPAQNRRLVAHLKGTATAHISQRRMDGGRGNRIFLTN